MKITNDKEFLEQMSLLQEKALPILKEKGPFYIDDGSGKKIEVSYENMKEMLGEMKATVAASKLLKDVGVLK